jgi:hypothetical protein
MKRCSTSLTSDALTQPAGRSNSTPKRVTAHQCGFSLNRVVPSSSSASESSGDVHLQILGSRHVQFPSCPIIAGSGPRTHLFKVVAEPKGTAPRGPQETGNRRDAPPAKSAMQSNASNEVRLRQGRSVYRYSEWMCPRDVEARSGSRWSILTRANGAGACARKRAIPHGAGSRRPRAR